MEMAVGGEWTRLGLRQLSGMLILVYVRSQYLVRRSLPSRPHCHFACMDSPGHMTCKQSVPCWSAQSSQSGVRIGWLLGGTVFA